MTIFYFHLTDVCENWRHTSLIRTQWVDSNPPPPGFFRVNGILLLRDMVVESCYRQFGRETIHQTQKYASMNLLQMSCEITWAQKKFSLQPQKKKAVFLKKINSNWDFDLEISHLRKKVFMPTSKMWIRTLYVKRFQSSDLFVFSTLLQRMNSAKRKILVLYIWSILYNKNNQYYLHFKVKTYDYGVFLTCNTCYHYFIIAVYRLE